MITRNQYTAGDYTHREYYSQFVNDHNKRLVLSNFRLERLIESHNTASPETHSSFNDIPLKQWDSVGAGGSKLLKECGDHLTLSGSVSIAKQCAEHLVREHAGIYYPDYTTLLSLSKHIDEPECLVNEDRPLNLCKQLSKVLKESKNLQQRELDTLNNLTRVIWRKDGNVVSAELYSERVNPDWLQFQIVVTGDEYQKVGDIVG